MTSQQPVQKIDSTPEQGVCDRQQDIRQRDNVARRHKSKKPVRDDIIVVLKVMKTSKKQPNKKPQPNPTDGQLASFLQKLSCAFLKYLLISTTFILYLYNKTAEQKKIG